MAWWGGDSPVAAMGGVRQVGGRLSDVAYQWRAEDPEGNGRGRVLRWLAVSLVIHVLVLGIGEGARRWVENNPERAPEWLKSAVAPRPEDPALQMASQRPEEEREVEIPLTFLEVDPERATDETPRDTRYMSTVNTLAANPNPPKPDAVQPRVDGTQEDSARILDVTRRNPVPPQPVAEPVEERPGVKVADRAQKAQEAREALPKVEPLAQPVVAAGETQLAKVTTRPVPVRPEVIPPVPPTTQPERVPRPEQQEQQAQAPQEETLPNRRPIKRLAEARQQKGILVGEQMKQDGGVSRLHIESSLDVKASPFANYDQQFIYAVQQRWYALLDQHRYSLDRTGKVKLKFELRSDGTVAEMNQLESEVGDIWSLLCENAILTQAPYARWPETMRRLIGKDTREITFTFHYR